MTENPNNPTETKSFVSGEETETISSSQNKENLFNKIFDKNTNNTTKKNLYENIGTRVSRLREINENYQFKTKQQDAELKMLDEKIKEKKNLLEKEMRNEKKLLDPEWVANKYQELLQKNQIKMKINLNHFNNDESLKKVYEKMEKEVGILQDRLNNLNEKTEIVKEEVNVLRVENQKYKDNIENIKIKKTRQGNEMDMISEDANKFLNEKSKITQELVNLSEKIDTQKINFESKMSEMNKMIDNAKKIKEFHETFALEKFSKNAFRKLGEKNQATSNNILGEEQNKLANLEKELKSRKRETVYLNFSRLILLKKQQKLNEMIQKIEKETGVENLDNLSKYLEISKNTNKLFETDLKNLSNQKLEMEQKIENAQKEYQNSECVLSDTSSKNLEILETLKSQLKKEEEIKESLNKKLYSMNRVIDLISKGFKDVCKKCNFTDESENTNLEAEVRIKFIFKFPS
jgi:hypothetical protein